MRILLTNDDGIGSPGLVFLRDALRERHEVVLAAPSGERSAVGHGITLDRPLFVRRLSGDEESYEISGTPADCVRLGLGPLRGDPVDLVISGPNRGYNLGFDLFYSGTVGAAMEAAMQGKRAIALSASPKAEPKEVVRIFLKLFSQLDPQKDIGEVLNINIPPLPLEKVTGVRWAPQALSFPWCDRYELRTSPSGQEYYWVHGTPNPVERGASTDVSGIEEGAVTLTPLTFSLNREMGFQGSRLTL